MRAEIRDGTPLINDGYNADAFFARVYLDGVELQNCVRADTATGVVVCLEPAEDGAIHEVEKRGKVGILIGSRD
jgi:hypothetical protein